MEQLGRLLLQHIRSQNSTGTSTLQHREVLVGRLGGVFRRFSFQPAAAFAHLALVALDLEQLRGDLLSRKLFAERVA
jgi:hypothetical protein